MMNVSPRFKRFIDDATGRPYIHDSETGEVKWELPEDRDWIELVDPASGRTYWYNQTTKSSQWENPAFRIVSPSKSPIKIIENQQQHQQNPIWKSKIDKATGRKYWYNRLTRESSWYPPPKTGNEIELSTSTISLGIQGNSNWKKFLDPTSNRAFYFHIKKGISQWEIPTELAQEAGMKDSSVVSGPPQKGMEFRQSLNSHIDDSEEGISRLLENRSKNISIIESSSFAFGGEDEEGSATTGRLSSGKFNSSAASSTDRIVLASELLEYVRLPVISHGEWRKREFRLLNNGTLQCGPSGFTNPDAQLDVNQIASIVEDLGKCQFTLEGSFSKTLIRLRTETSSDCAKWTRAISECILNATVSSEQESTSEEVFHESTKMISQVTPRSAINNRLTTAQTVAMEQESTFEESFHETTKLAGQTTPKVAAPNGRHPITFQMMPDSPGLLQRLISQAGELKIKLADAESAFHSAYAHVHEWKVKSLASRWTRKKDRGAGLGAETDPNSMAHYASLWTALRSHPNLIARIGSTLKSNEAKRMFASTLVTSLLDPCSIPPSLCLTQVVSASIGSSFEGPLSEALATYSEYQTSMRAQLEWLFNGEEKSVTHALARFSQSLELCCPRYLQLYGRRFYSELVRNVILEERNSLADPSTADEFLSIIENRSSNEFESRIDAVLNGEETSKTELFTGPFLPIEKWSKFVSTSFELFALHMAISKHHFSLPEDVRIALQELGKPKPMFVSNGEHPYFALDLPLQQQKAAEYLEQAIDRAKNCNKNTDYSEEDFQNEKEVIKNMLAAIEKARMLLDSYRQSTEYVNRFTLIFAEKQAQFERGLLSDPRFGTSFRRPSVPSATSSPFSVTVTGLKKPSERSVLSEAPFDAQVSPMEMQRKVRSADNNQARKPEWPSPSSPPQVPIPISFSPASFVSNDYSVDDESELSGQQQQRVDPNSDSGRYDDVQAEWASEYYVQQGQPVGISNSPMFNFARATASSTQKEVFLPGAAPKNPWLAAGGTVSHHRKGS